MRILNKISSMFEEKSNECEAKMYDMTDNNSNQPCIYTEVDIEEAKSQTWMDASTLLYGAEEELKNDLLEELRECKKNCGEGSDCSVCLLGSQDSCVLQDLQIDSNNGWIPCSIRCPSKEECGRYGENLFQVTVPHLGESKTLCMKYQYTTVRGKDIQRWIWNGRVSPWIVLAWKPMDKPMRSNSVFTSGDYIRSLNDEQLVEWIMSHDELTHEAGRLGKTELLNWLKQDAVMKNIIRR